MDLLKDFWKDITERKNKDAILCLVALVLSLIFFFNGLTNNSLFNFLLVMNLVLLGWVLQSGWKAREQGEKPKILILGGIALILYVFKVWQLSDAIAQLATFRENFQNLQHYIDK